MYTGWNYLFECIQSRNTIRYSMLHNRAAAKGKIV